MTQRHYIASYIEAKGIVGLFDDIKALYKDEKNKWSEETVRRNGRAELN